LLWREACFSRVADGDDSEPAGSDATNAMKHKFGRLKKLAFMVGTAGLALTERRRRAQPSACVISLRFERSQFNRNVRACKVRRKDKFLHTFMDRSRLLYLKARELRTQEAT